MNNKILLLLLQECMKNYTEEGTADGCLRLSPRPLKEDVVTRYELLPLNISVLCLKLGNRFTMAYSTCRFKASTQKMPFAVAICPKRCGMNSSCISSPTASFCFSIIMKSIFPLAIAQSELC